MGKVNKTEQEWKELLSDEEFHVCREKGTERPFTGRYWDCKDEGVYLCACCQTKLFDSATKYDSGSGWPSFFQPSNKEHIKEETDGSLAMQRTEVLCNACGSHLGHVFPDGPAPTGLRYCINSLSLKLQKK